MIEQSELSQVFVTAANNHLDLIFDQDIIEQDWYIRDNIEFIWDSLEKEKSPYMCDALGSAIDEMYLGESNYSSYLDDRDQVIDIMLEEGLPSTGFSALSGTPNEFRQEHRWFFLMFIAESLK